MAEPLKVIGSTPNGITVIVAWSWIVGLPAIEIKSGAGSIAIAVGEVPEVIKLLATGLAMAERTLEAESIPSPIEDRP